MAVVVDHIVRMLADAIDKAREAAKDGDAEMRLRFLERASNLATHAAAELDDERLRLRDHWHVV